jgi:hypothetical protein
VLVFRRVEHYHLLSDRGFEVAIPAEVRLRRYGIHRDPFSAAR